MLFSILKSLHSIALLYIHPHIIISDDTMSLLTNRAPDEE